MTATYAPISDATQVALSAEKPLELVDGTSAPDYAFVTPHRVAGTAGMVAVGRGEEWDMFLTAGEARDLASAILAAVSKAES